jgi:hypothetical protein
MRELEDSHQAFDRKRHHDDDHKPRQESPDASGRAHLHFPLHFLFEYRLPEFKSNHRNGQQPNTLEDRIETVPERQRRAGVESMPKLHSGKEDQSEAAADEQKNNQ